MKKVLKWLGVALGGLVGMILLAVAAVYAISTSRFNRTYEVQVEPVPIPTDPESIAYGEHIASIRGCKACHGEDLSGEIEFQDPMVGVIANANLTGGAGSEVIDYTVEDFLTAMRTGVTPGGRQLDDEWMPYETLFGDMTDEEWEAIWLYLQTLPPREYGNR